MESARFCKQLLDSPGFAGLQKKVEAELTETGNRLVLMQIKPEAMLVVAERAKARYDLIKEIVMESQRFETLEARYESFSKAHNKN